MNKYLKGIPIIDEVELDGKVVFIRCDLNVPLKNGVVTNDYRIKASLPTIKYAMSQGAKVVVGSHLGRPKTEEDKKALSMEPVAEKLREFLENNVYLVEDSLSETTRGLLSGLKKGDLILLENLRFIPGETKNGPELPNAVADYADVYVNDAFGASHRAHSSIVGIPKMVKTSCVGFLMKKEIEMLSEVIASPEKPYVAILGGSKVSDKIEIIDKLIDAVDTFIIGGAMAYTFLKAQGIGVGKSLVEEDKLTFIKNFIKRKDSRGKKLLLPIDHVVAKEFSSPECEIVSDIGADQMGLDIGPKSIELFQSELVHAKTVFWNGPMGVFENPLYNKGTFGIAKALSELQAKTIIGGGDSASAAIESGYSDKMTHVSTGGGASLEFLQGVELPGLLVLKNKLFT